MNRRSFLGVALAAIMGWTLGISRKAIVPVEVAASLPTDEYSFIVYGSLNGMIYCHMKCGDKESIQYISVDGEAGFAETSPQNVLRMVSQEI